MNINHYTRLYKRQHAAATVELLIVMPFLLLIFLGSMDLARVIRTYIELNSAVRIGVTAGTRLLQQKEPTPGWRIEGDNSITILLPVADSMELAAENDLGINITPDEKSVLCRCVTRNVAGIDVSGEIVECDDDEIKGCLGFRQIHLRFQASLPFNTVFDWSWITGTSIVSAVATMEGDEI